MAIFNVVRSQFKASRTTKLIFASVLPVKNKSIKPTKFTKLSLKQTNFMTLIANIPRWDYNWIWVGQSKGRECPSADNFISSKTGETRRHKAPEPVKW